MRLRTLFPDDKAIIDGCMHISVGGLFREETKLISYFISHSEIISKRI